MPLILSGNVATATAATGYNVDNSCMFNDGDSAAMSRDQSANDAGTNTKGTLSVWLKRTTIGVEQVIYTRETDASNYFKVWFENDRLLIQTVTSGSVAMKRETNRVFRDPSAWMNVVVILDSTDGTAADRQQIWINGSRETSFANSTNIGSSANLQINTGTGTDYIGRRGSGNYYDGYMAELVWIDGTDYAATSFGEFNEDSPNIWQPIDVSGLTFGTNGFYLDFEASGNLGNDVSGGTDFTEANLAAIDQCVDTCTNNFATMNPLVKGNTALTFSQGNLKLTSGGGWGHAVGSIGVAHGKWYWEVDEINASNNAFFGICNEFNLGHLDGDSTPYSENGLMLYFYDGRRTIDGTSSEGEYNAWGTTHGFALDLDSDPRTIKFYKDNSLEATENLTANFPAGEFVFPIFMGSASSNPAIVEFNFGNPATALASAANDANGYGSFEFAPPSGYIAICTKNLGSDGG